MAVELDQIDHAILAALERDGRISNVDLADLVGLSPSPVLRRVRRLEELGVIRGYRAVLDPEAVGRAFRVIVAAEVAAADRKSIHEFEDAISRLPGVRTIHHVAGSFDYMLVVEVADLAAYDHFTRNVLSEVPHLRTFTSHVVMSTIEPVDSL